MYALCINAIPVKRVTKNANERSITLSEQRLMERQKAYKRLNQLIELRDLLGDDNKWLNDEINEIETFLREKEGQTA